ncbi:MAG: nitrous oxide reductase accessory protein NosL [Planctomycetota bacterium]|jgi:copper chaperone NosL
MTTHSTRLTLALVSIAALGSCAPGEPTGPPAIILGEHVCDQCNMIISDERSASASLVVDNSQRTTHKRFDDINCMLNFEGDHPDIEILQRWVHDHTTLAWLDAQSAVYLHSSELRTPMGSNLAAHTNSESALAHQEELGGEIMALEDLLSSE